MKLTITTIKETNASDGLMDSLKVSLKNKEYKVISSSSDSLIFEQDSYNSKGLTRGDYYTRVQDAKITVDTHLKKARIELIYHIDITFEFVILTLLSLAGVMLSYDFFIFFGLLVINLGCKIYYLNNHFIDNILH